jgi:hypothetical protein
MKVRKLLQLQSEIEERKVPCDLCDDELNQHHSQSKGEFINILDMDLIHLVRSYSKTLSHRDELKSQEILDDLDVIENRVSSVKSKFKNLD